MFYSALYKLPVSSKQRTPAWGRQITCVQHGVIAQNPEAEDRQEAGEGGRRSSALQLQCVTLHTTDTIIVSSTCFSCHHRKSISHSDETFVLKLSVVVVAE